MSAKEDPAAPAFWDTRFRQKRTPWDAAATPPELERYLAQESGGGQVLIPGCGSAYEARTFAEKGYEVAAIDFSMAAVERAGAILGALRDIVIFGDFFSYDFCDRRFDIVYERAFLASLPRTMWPDFARRVGELLRPEGRLIGFFVYGEQQGGPPFCLKKGELFRLLGDKFERSAEAVVTTSVPVFEGKERWEVWTRMRSQTRNHGVQPTPASGRG